MTDYLFRHLPTGKVGTVAESKLEDALLEIVGGGYTEKQVAMAMVIRAELRTGEMVRTANFEITPIPEEVAA